MFSTLLFLICVTYIIIKIEKSHETCVNFNVFVQLIT